MSNAKLEHFLNTVKNYANDETLSEANPDIIYSDLGHSEDIYTFGKQDGKIEFARWVIAQLNNE